MRVPASVLRVTSVFAVIVAGAMVAGAADAESISGHLTGMLEPGACVTATPEAGGAPTTVAVGVPGDTNGFSIAVAGPGAYTVTVTSACAGPTKLSARMTVASRTGVVVAAGADTTGVDLRFVRGNATLPISVPSGYRVAGLCVTVHQGGTAIDWLGITASGGIMLPFLPPGSYVVRVAASTPACSGQRSLRDGEGAFTIVDDQTVEIPEISLRERGAGPATGSVAALGVSAPIVTATAITQPITAPAAGIATQVGTFAASARAGSVVRACRGSARVQAGSARVVCRLTAAAKTARAQGMIRVTLVTTLVAKGKTYRATRVVVLPKTG